jgi:hypothetical protein
MERLIDEVFNIVKDYRERENKMSFGHIEKWITQFPKSDRVFLLTELKYILKKRYYSKEFISSWLEKAIVKLSKKYYFQSPIDFLKQSIFIDNQRKGISQKILLKLKNDVLINKFSFDVLNHNPSMPRYFIYLDDFLCTGNTLFRGLTNETGQKGWLNLKDYNDEPSNLHYLFTNDAKIILLYLVIHKKNYENYQMRLDSYFNSQWQIFDFIDECIYKQVENDFENIDSKLDYLIPFKENQPINILDYSNILNLFNIKTPKDAGIFRNQNHPVDETFFTSKENRIRFENIILHQSMKIYEKVGNNNPRRRPLGYDLASHKNLGFGALCFTYYNAPFNSPLVFWYSKKNVWIPLFERKFITYEDIYKYSMEDYDIEEENKMEDDRINECNNLSF